MIGINSQIETGGGGNGNVGIGFAIPINTARDVVDQIEQDGKVEHAFLGISGGDDHARRSPRRSTCRSTRASWSQEVVQDGPADKAGHRGRRHRGDDRRRQRSRLGGDIITAIDGKTVSRWTT